MSDSSEQTPPPRTNVEDDDDDEISLLDLAIVLAKHKKLLLFLPITAAAIATVVVLLLPSTYTATTRVLPPQQSQSSTAAMLDQLSGLTGLAGGIPGLKNPSDLYVGMLKSRTVADNIVQRFDLKKVYDEEYLSKTRKKLEKETTFSSGKDGIISIEVDDKDPRRAADLANAYVDELLKLTQVLAVTEASQRRLFFERQFAQAKDNLASAEVAARKALAQGGLVNVDIQGRAMVETIARLRAQITVKDVQIGAMRAFAAGSNPELRLAQQELESLKRELARIEGVGGSAAPAAGASGQGIESLRLLRDVKYHEVLFELLARQYEVAKIDEAKESAVIQVMDKAIEPDRKSKPKRALIVLMSAFFALFVAVLWAFVRELFANTAKDPAQAERLQMFKRHLKWRRNG